LKREGVVQPKPYAKAEQPNAKKDTHTDGKGKSESQPTCDRDIQCFKCLGKEGAHCILVSKPMSYAYKRQWGG
jgi:hypothetical protein